MRTHANNRISKSRQVIYSFAIEKNMQTHMRYLLWECSPTSETRGKKTEQPKYCKNWSVRKTTRPMRTGRTLRHKMQMCCPYCGNRPRKDEASVWVYENRDAAYAECERRNASHAFLKPNTTVVIGDDE